MDDKRFPGYTALLPPRVRYDRELRPTAKLLYGEISAMADVTGFCWASNRYLAALFGVTKGTITDLLAQLADRGYPADVTQTYARVGGTPHLDFHHTVFGQVFEGMDVVDAIAAVETDRSDKPLRPVVIRSIDVTLAE